LENPENHRERCSGLGFKRKRVVSWGFLAVAVPPKHRQETEVSAQEEVAAMALIKHLQ
ncbi:hypothetical protein U1Q18_024676, partial [Sarracenia purpurea var. burkii]